MGPIIILDKSALQALSKDEISFLYKHYFVVIPPVLIVEIIGDLSKKDKPGRISEDWVRHLADKLHAGDSCINVFYRTAGLASLAGHHIPMDGTGLVSGGVPLVTSTGERGVFVEEPPERKAILKWRLGNFSESERILSQRWRESSQGLNLEELQRVLKKQLPHMPKIKDVNELFGYVHTIADESSNQRKYIVQTTAGLTKSISFMHGVIQRWAYMGKPPFKQFAPYAYFCFKATLAFHLALAAGIISAFSKSVDVLLRENSSSRFSFFFCFFFSFSL